ncbi:transcriptional regulator GutM [Alkalibacter saccharofermentans]|uniref:DNA-binding transcriptional regulator of glucitol operon n=1 Tax=Alkalibacter saccharofermentans DSM 14828 TaxID=1120975 RepID=A0A1M4W0G1_9FIRM|nr:transcriptional regulator GutM [Alkalibacter saccharofermentans]SHE74603.1 DNA-binding transcriptional regulator of glucitol operon [Alkalibacter saccharofermentans DSM 14828]
MNDVVRMGLVIAVFWLLNAVLGMRQVKDFNKNYIELKKKSRVLIGRKRGYLQAGTVILLAIDDQDVITEARKMQGVSIFARVKAFSGLTGKEVEQLLDEALLKNYNRYTQKALKNAYENFVAFNKEKSEKNEMEASV